MLRFLQHEGRTQRQAGFFPNTAGPMPLLGDAKAARRGGQHQQGARTARQLGKRLGDAPIEVAIIAIVTPILLRAVRQRRSEEHTSELQSLMRISYAVFCLKKKNTQPTYTTKYTKHIQSKA